MNRNRIYRMLTVLAVVFFAAGCAGSEADDAKEVDCDETKVTIETTHAGFQAGGAGSVSSLDWCYTIHNQSAAPLIQVDYELIIKKKNGEQVAVLPHSLNMQDQTIPPQGSHRSERRFSELDLQADPAELAVDAVVTGVVTSKEMKPVSKPEIQERSAELDGFICKMKGLEVAYAGYYGIMVTPTVTAVNHSGREIMQVDYELRLFDPTGEEIDTISCAYQAVDKPIKVGERRALSSGSYPRVVERQVASVAFCITKLYDTEEKPPLVIPEKGDPVYKAMGNPSLAAIDQELPKEIHVWSDRSGMVQAGVIDREQDIEAAVNLFKKVKIASEGPSVTDQYHSVKFVFADDTTCFLSLDGGYLQFSGYGQHYSFEMENFDEFWSYVSGFATEEGVYGDL